MNTVRDYLSSDEKKNLVTSGSFGEGLEMRGSDLDIMFIENRIEVYEDVKPRIHPNIPFLSMKTKDVKPGFTMLQLEYNRYHCFSKYFVELNGRHYFSNALYKQQFLTEKSNIHGPCLSNGLMDLAVCVHCKTWITHATHWITRSNNSWPSKDVKQFIIKNGVLFVRIGVKGSSKEDLEWRISFSVGEKLLINSFTHS
ncbi:Hypothetical predicted protein [Mytilus galloprovincialis]|uniref:Mab-21-like nucleotidyltransferase domain-containing protein n=1 Tax=Mytilus galloprovincialis TaxID=29158 RepID=A0A8B6E7Y7_MYTGA|nr:Hypothetical predicted protein [Mytilus galloprovincialis]